MFYFLSAAPDAAKTASEGVQSLSIPGAPEWLNWILVVAVPIVTFFLAKWLHGKSKETKAMLADKKLSGKAHLELKLRDFVLERAAVFVERDIMNIAQELIGKPKEGQIHATKQKLKKLGEQLATEAKEYFKAHDVDIIKELGEAKIHQLIEWAANQVSPFPGKPTAKTMVEGGAELLLNNGVDWVKRHVTTHE